MRYISFRLAVFALSASFFILGGCLGKGTTKPTKFYVLNSLYSSQASTQSIANLQDKVIGVGPVRLPLQLDRPQIVTRTAQNEIQLTDFAQWAEPLKDNFSRVLAENLAILLGTDNVAIFPWMKSERLDYQITVDVTGFSGSAGGDVSLRARWSIYGDDGKKELLKSASNISETAGSDDIEAMVAAQSRTVEMLSREIAEAVKALSEGKATGK